jgi:negative regulator of flagellin synthesis FlgM
MDIKNLNGGVLQTRSNEPVKNPGQESTDKNSAAASQAKTDNSDKVTLTQAVAQVSNLEQKALSVDIDNSARIAELKSAIQDGSYQIDAERVADKLMQTEALFARF